MGTHLRVLYERYPMSTNMTGSRLFSKICALVLWTNEALTLKGLNKDILIKIVLKTSLHLFILAF